MLTMPLTSACTFVLVRPHYPENVGAAARAMKVMGLSRLILVRPSRFAQPDHEMARRMAVKSLDVLSSAERADTLEAALRGHAAAFATTSRRGVSGVLVPRAAALSAQAAVARGERVAFVFGNEKTGLSAEERELCGHAVRIPIAADQPSLNLAQAVQILAYELFLAGLEQRASER